MPIRQTHMNHTAQNGAITLLVGLMLLMASSILTLGVVRLGIMEQRMANNELRAKEAHQAAQAGLEFARSQPLPRAGEETNTFPQPSLIEASGDYRYQVLVRHDHIESCTRVRAHAQALDQDGIAHPNISAVVSECQEPASLLRTGFAGGAPPLVVNGCLGRITGNPRIHPNRCDEEQTHEANPVCQPIALVSSQGMTCLETGHLDLNEGVVVAEGFSGSAWDYLFALDQASMRALADIPDSGVHWITARTSWRGATGSPEQPVILIFDQAAGCPKFLGNTTLYGIIYYAEPSECDNQGWGAVTVHGSVILEGSLGALNANTELRHWSLLSHAGPLARAGSRLSRPGSWRDWD
ncbi:hypothetical protein CKO25_12155 [Thiocapsa imhoffii]|uniref:Type 4 fimbrial biogenesis protein PilX N-terminal domain-containing protein n=1 Tax=Thiocapsa imhoffii TaxID=382777 RepID=A0A9X0WJN2_9GAMM|nr:PilX N-terminal domain-containing pilus assembly protein [Thiocapsa imhoffii]MBK1645382.1 hypothetical protein [Thiocapsa imhoffii]